MNIVEKIEKYIARKKQNKFLISNVNSNVVEGFFDQIKDIICITDYDGTIEYINNGDVYNKYKRLKEVLFYDQNNELIYEEIISQTLDEGNYMANVQLNKDGNKVDTYIAAYKMQSQGKLFIYIKNLNEYFEKELELKKEIEKKDEFIRSKDLFIANLSHEIRTPINIIVGMLYFLKSTQLDEKQIGYIEKLEQASTLLLEMVNNILDLSKDKQKLVVNNKTNFNLKAFLDNLYTVFEEKMKEKNLQWYITSEFDTNIDIYADKTKIGQVFLNLVNNAIKYTNKGYIEVHAKKVEETNFYYKIQFCVKDTGIGIKKEDSLKVFAEFEQVDDPTTKSVQGSGMGLAITKKIIENMDGKIWLESTVDLGSKFYFNIIVDKSTEDKQEEINEHENVDMKKTEEIISENEYNLKNIAAKLNNQNESEELNNKKILIVEDNLINIEITKCLLEELGIVCETVTDGTECLEKVQEVGKNYFDLILMDIHMPKHNGYEISKILKDNIGLQIPIVALTATNITEETIEEHKNYINSYIQKPIIPVEFKKKIKELLFNNKITECKIPFIDSFDEMMERIGNNEQTLKKLLNIFYNTYINIRKDLANINNDNEKYIYIHSLKGALGNLGSKKLYQKLSEIEADIKIGEAEKKLNSFLNEFDESLKSIRESKYLDLNKVLIINENQEEMEFLKNELYPFFEIYIAKEPKEIYLIIDAQEIDAIIIDKLNNKENKIELVTQLRSNDKYKNIAIIMFNKDKESDVKTISMEADVDEYIENEIEIDDLKWEINDAISDRKKQLKMKKDLNDSNKEIENVYDFLYSSLVNLTAYKSKETGGHLLRTKEYMKTMLNEYERFYHEGLFVEDKTIEEISIAATLHDIGKVGIPDNILNKPGKLTDEEYEVMKQHVVIGKDTLEGQYENKLSNNVLQYAKDIVYHHHEKFDGTGYPEKLKNDEITIISRIMAVIDVYDALVNDRVYKKAMPYEEAEEYIINQSGKAFDPKIINIFRIAKDKMKKINIENQ